MRRSKTYSPIPSIAPAQVWAGLTAEAQAGAIRLMAQPGLQSRRPRPGIDPHGVRPMPPRLSHPKIRPEHLDRQALIYVRQSTPMQVRDNIASTARQYDLARRAEQFGWPKEHIHVIDQDQGHSGASALGRDGFQYLMAEVGLGRAGAVLSLEASRLARSCSDWYRLIEICGLTDTLVIDEDGVYDPTQYNDRLLLGIKGTMSEAELHWIRSRLLGGKLEKARDRPAPLPAAHRAGLRPRRPDRPRSRRAGAAGGAPGLRHLRAGGGRARGRPVLRRAISSASPPGIYGGSRDGQLTWRPLDHGRVLAILHNPAYTGTYVYGRTKTRNVVLPGEEPRIKGRTRRVAAEDWPFVLHDHHPGYITWEQFQRNQQRLIDNCTFDHQERSRGDPRRGGAAAGPRPVRAVRAAHDDPLHGRRQDPLVRMQSAP